jgi:hypothetical protein
MLNLVLFSPLYAYITWYILRRIMHKKRQLPGFLTWSFIIQAVITPFFWILHSLGFWAFVESSNTSFDPIIITDHVAGFFATYLIFCGGLTIAVLWLVKWKSA